VAFYARRYLARHRIDEAGLAVSTTYRLTDRPTRVGAINVCITPPIGFPEERRVALLSVASHCTVHNSLAQPPTVTIELDE
jgi:uncharacterized OsmC-like protein